ncbi:SPOR domain-containing protein [Seohaeicola saemankumensis]|uniref:SPOR domain-containing protein n=1 Tax=Seohaeicola saemankumensis TaxID=481181 RepID=A0ABW3TEV8_9RHOB
MTADRINTPFRRKAGTAVLVALGMLALTGCDESGQFSLLQNNGASGGETSANRSVRLVERDVEAPDIFQVTEAGLWDGRPSLGGVWVAHPDVTEPERVIIRNTSNGNFVIGALFRREVNTPGPRVQVSSDAAATLAMLAGQPVQLNVTALRREEVPTAASEETDEAQAMSEALPAPGAITESRLDPIASAAAAIEAAPVRPAAATASPTPPPTRPATAPGTAVQTAAAAPAPRASGLDKPYLQIGIFSIEANANRAATAMRNAGMVPEVRQQTSQGKTFWRVLVGPAGTAAERSTLLAKIKEEGFTDAYAVRN